MKSKSKGGYIFFILTYMGSFVSPGWDFDHAPNLASSYKGLTNIRIVLLSFEDFEES